MLQEALSVVAAVGILFGGTNALADNHQKTETKPISKVSDIQSMPDDSVVYIQGYVVEDLGDDNYKFKDDSGTINIEIDEDIMEGNNVVGEAMMFITATVDKDGNVTSLDAEEVDIIPVPAENNTKTNSDAKTMPTTSK